MVWSDESWGSDASCGMEVGERYGRWVERRLAGNRKGLKSGRIISHCDNGTRANYLPSSERQITVMRATTVTRLKCTSEMCSLTQIATQGGVGVVTVQERNVP